MQTPYLLELQAFCEALQSGDAAGVERQFNSYLKKTISIRDTFVRRDTKENFYHGILLGLLGYKGGWYVRSNREAGTGYSDIQVEIEDEGIGIVIEVKYAHHSDMESLCEEALAQIERARYAEQLSEVGMHTVLQYGIACYQKTCRVVCRQDDYIHWK